MIGGLSNRLHRYLPDWPLLRCAEYHVRHALGTAANMLVDGRNVIRSMNDPGIATLQGRYCDFEEDVVWRGGHARRARKFREKLKTYLIHRKPSKVLPHIVFFLEGLSRTGGNISVVQLANDLVEIGYSVEVVFRMPHDYGASLELRCPAHVILDETNISPAILRADLVVATYWPTFYRMMDLFLRNPSFLPAYFVQDFEPLFVPETRTRVRGYIEETYRLTPYCFAKTPWICEQVRAVGGNIALVPPGLDLTLFSPGMPTPSSGKKMVLTMLRPATPQRGFDTALKVLGRLSAERDDIEINAFGSTDEELNHHRVSFPLVNHGRLPNVELPALYRKAWCFTDFSLFHGFGRTVAEAMACGTPSVLTNSGGVSTFAVHEGNCLMAAPGDVNGLVASLRRMLDEEGLRDRLGALGLQSVLPFERRQSAEYTAALFQSWIEANSAQMQEPATELR